MNPKVIKQHLKAKGFTLAADNKINVYTNNLMEVVAAFNTTTGIVVSWVIPTNTIPHTVVLCYKDSTDVRFKGKISNLQQFNLILNAVE